MDRASIGRRSATKRIVVVANKTWEALPLCGVLTNPKATAGPYLMPLSRGPRGFVNFDSCLVEIWCLQDSLSVANQSNSEAKWAALPSIIGNAADLVIAFGTAATLDEESLNGCSVVGTRAFVHDTVKNVSAPWPSADLDVVKMSAEGERLLSSAWSMDTDLRPRAESRFLTIPMNPARPPVILQALNYVAVSDVDVPSYNDYAWADQAALDAFRKAEPRGLFGSLETTHGLIRLSSEFPFLFVSGITDRIGHFNEDVGTRDYAQNFVAAHNAAMTLASLLPSLVKALDTNMADGFTFIVNFNNPAWVPNKTFALPYAPNTTVRDALFSAYDRYHQTDPEFVFDLRYSGKDLGDFVQTLCGIPTTPSSSWEIFINGDPAPKGIDSLIESPNETVTFRYVLDRDELHSSGDSKRAAYGQRAKD